MGRKARYRKYKAIDPFCTGLRKDLLLRQENSFNKAPKKEDFEQKPPKGYIDLMGRMNREKSRRNSQRKQNDYMTGENVGVMPKPMMNNGKKEFKRKTWESDDQYLSRVDRMATDIIANEKMAILKSGGDGEEAPKRLTKEKERKLKKIKKAAAEAKMKKLEEQKDYTAAVKNEMMLDSLEKEMMKDDVQFGEVVVAPPTLTKAPRKSHQAAKPGQRELLLKGLMGSAATRKQLNTAGQRTKVKHKLSEVDTRKAKRRKDMSAVEKTRYDQTREAVIEAYRKQRNTSRIDLVMSPVEEPT